MIKLFYISFLFIILGCSGNIKKLPEGIMTKDQMVAYLIDLQLTEAKIASLKLPEDTVKLFYDQVEKELYKRHHISDSTYLKSISYYLYDVKGIEEIYSAVVDSLSLRERLQNTN
jgi:hypothetical protein